MKAENNNSAMGVTELIYIKQPAEISLLQIYIGIGIRVGY